MELTKYLVDNLENSRDFTRHIINSLSLVDLKRVKRDLERHYTDNPETSYLMGHVERRLFPEQVEKVKKKPNATINQLLRDFKDEKSGLIAASRLELQKRFEYQSFEDQKRIIDAFMFRTTKHDVVWCSKYLLSDWFWRDIYFDSIVWYWEREMDNYPLLRVVCKYASDDYLKEKVQQFEEENEGVVEVKAYMLFLSRLAKDPNFVINKDRLKPFQYVCICSKTNRQVTQEEANTALLQVVLKSLSEGLFFNKFRRKRDGTVVFRSGCMIEFALWTISKTGNTDVLIRFNEWVKEMCYKIENMQDADYDEIVETVSRVLRE